MTKPKREEQSYLISRDLKAYVGITLDSPQFCGAEERLGLKESNTNALFKIYCAVARKPESWTAESRGAVSVAIQINNEKGNHETWLFGHSPLQNWATIQEISGTIYRCRFCTRED
jgi:hypothetical protein